MPDGSVWTAGSSPTRDTWEPRTEIYKPDYFFSGNRPSITGTPLVGDYGNSITISTPDAANISSVSLVKLPCATHSYDVYSRLIWLQVTNSTSGSVTVKAPLNTNLAPQGYYMIHILNGSNIPSVAKIIKIPGSGTGVPDATAPGQVMGLTVMVVSSTQLNLAWTSNTEPDLNHYNVYRGTTVGFNVTPGTTTPVGTPTTNSFSNTGLNPSTTYYYKVAAVDNVGNIGSLSTEQSGITNPPADTMPPTVTSTTPANGATGVAVTSVITATFSEVVQASTVTSSTFILKDSNGTSVAGTVKLSGDGRTGIFTPSSPLASSTSYTATVSGVKNLAGTAMASPKVWSFITASS